MRKRAMASVVLLAAACLLGTLSGCQLVSVTGSGELETLEMDLSGFTSVNISQAFEATITRSDTHFVSVTVDDNLVEYLNVRTSGSTLYIGMKSGLYTNTTQQAIVHMPELRNVTLSGASDVDLSGFSISEDSRFGLSGASRLTLSGMTCADTRFNLSGASHVSGSIEMGDARFSLSGASDAELEGSAGDIDIGASGASHAKLASLVVDDAKVSLSGASSAVVNASGTISGGLNGASKLQYIGSPTLGKISTSGGSTVASK